MMDETTAQTVIAGITVTGSFTVVVISQVTGVPPSQGVLTLITAVLTGVVGFYFGSRSTAAAGTAAADTAVRTASAVAAATSSGTDPLNPSGTEQAPGKG